MPDSLTRKSLMRGLSHLVKVDADLARIHAEYGTPPMWERAPGFATLVHIILEQQVSLASARATYERLVALAAPPAPLAPESFLALDDETLRRVGFSRQKTAYCRNLARAVLEGELDLRALEEMSDEVVCEHLTSVKGIGRWTAEIYLLMVLRRRDVWPAGDLALALAAQCVKNLPQRPTPDELRVLSMAWQPWRAVAARLLWNYYLNAPKKTTTK